MSLDRVDVQVSISDPNGPPVPNAEVCARLKIALEADERDFQVRLSHEEWDTLGIAWPGCVYDSGVEEAEQFTKDLAALFKKVAMWIIERADALRALSEEGRFQTTFLIMTTVSRSQFDVELPVELVETCARARLRILVYGDAE